MSRILLISALAAAVISSSLYAASNGKISGTVYGVDGSKGLGGAMVYIYDSRDNIVDSVQSSISGFFEIEVSAGTYKVSADKGNYIREYYPDTYSRAEAGEIRIFAGENIAVSFNLERGGWIGGVFDVEGEDVDYGLVTALKIDQPYAGLYKSAPLHGSFPRNYAISGLPPGTYKVLGRASKKHTSYFPGVDEIDEATAVEVNPNSGVPDISFLLESAGEGFLAGTVVDAATGMGLANVSVFAYQWRDMAQDPNLTITSTERDGSYFFRLSAGDYFVSARCEDCYSSLGTISLYYNDRLNPELADPVHVGEGNMVESIDFGFDFSNSYDLSISGQILNEQTGEGLGGVIVSAIDYSSGETVNGALSLSNGNFSIDYLSSGTYLIMFSGTNVIPYFYRDCETWQDAETVELQSNFRGIRTEAITQDYGNMGLSISGRVTARSEPLDGARIYAYLVGDDRPTAYARTTASGEYSLIRGLIPGSYIIVCDLYGFDSQTYPEIIEIDLLENPTVENIDFHLSQPSTDINDRPNLPQMIQVLGNYPNPFNGQTSIQVYSGYANSIATRLVVFDLLGREVGSKSVSLEPGMNYIIWGTEAFGAGTSSGVYFYKIDNLDRVHRMLLLK